MLALARPPRAGGGRQIDGKCVFPKQGMERIAPSEGWASVHLHLRFRAVCYYRPAADF